MRQLVEEWWLVRDEVKQLLFNRYVFGTLQEIVRRNPRLQGPVRGKFSDWSQVVYNVANGVAVRRLAGDYQRGDVSSEWLAGCVWSASLRWCSTIPDMASRKRND